MKIQSINLKRIALLVVIYFVYKLFNGYNPYLPSLPVYPNNDEEMKLVEDAVKNRTQQDIAFFHKTNKSLVEAFVGFVPETREELRKIKISQNYIILFFKYLINRRRTYQINPNLNVINIKTAQTPSYPSGHAYQAYLIANKLSKRYPEKKDMLYEIARKCDDCRVKAGIYFPSDGEFSKKLVAFFN
jgi:hypothetical protein